MGVRMGCTVEIKFKTPTAKGDLRSPLQTLASRAHHRLPGPHDGARLQKWLLPEAKSNIYLQGAERFAFD
eukprot:3239985-Prymnesium_polylepis.1